VCVVECVAPQKNRQLVNRRTGGKLPCNQEAHAPPVEDFEAILRAISKQKEPVILVGGHAVNVWASS